MQTDTKIDALDQLSKEQLSELVRIYARNLLALDGLWFQSIEQKQGMDDAMWHDENVWRTFTEIEARRIREFLALPPHPGLEGLERALVLRFAAFANRSIEIRREDDSLLFRVVDCRVQSARSRKGMPWHPCRPVGIKEYTYFAKAIDNRALCEPVSCYPEITDPSCACAWRFRITEPNLPDEL